MKSQGVWPSSINWFSKHKQINEANREIRLIVPTYHLDGSENRGTVTTSMFWVTVIGQPLVRK